MVHHLSEIFKNFNWYAVQQIRNKDIIYFLLFLLHCLEVLFPRMFVTMGPEILLDSLDSDMCISPSLAIISTRSSPVRTFGGVSPGNHREKANYPHLWPTYLCLVHTFFPCSLDVFILIGGEIEKNEELYNRSVQKYRRVTQQARNTIDFHVSFIYPKRIYMNSYMPNEKT